MQLYNDDVADNRKRLDKLSAGVEPVASFLFNLFSFFQSPFFSAVFLCVFVFSLAGDLFLRFCGGGTTGSLFRFCGRGAGGGGRFMDSSGSGFSTFCCFFFFLV